jgi:hypothetical protein
VLKCKIIAFPTQNDISTDEAAIQTGARVMGGDLTKKLLSLKLEVFNVFVVPRLYVFTVPESRVHSSAELPILVTEC